MKMFRHEILNKRTLGGGFRAIPEEPLNPTDLLQTIKNAESANHRFLMQYFSPLFFCFRQPSSWDMTCMQIMAKAIRTSGLEYRIEFVSTPPEVDTFIESQGTYRGRTIESGNHMGMKRWVRDHLSRKGIAVARDEVSQLGYEVDVGCLAERIFVECGDTEPKKVFEFLKHGYDIGVLQYDSEDIVWFLSSTVFRDFADKAWEKLYGF